MDLLDLTEIETTSRAGGAQVVDFLRFRAERMNDGAGEASGPASLEPAAPARPLSARQVEHRTRMLRHLTRR